VVAIRKRNYATGLNNLIEADERIAALGRFPFTAGPTDIGKIQTPLLRNAALTVAERGGRVEFLRLLSGGSANR
jgi:hypothetical protein